MNGKRIFLSPPYFGKEERDAVSDAFDSGYIAPCGPMVDEFENRLSMMSGIAATAVTSGTAAIDLLMHELGVSEGDTVIVSTLTFIASAGPAYHRGANLVFVDCDSQTGNMSVPLLKQAIADHPKAKCVIAVDLYGACCDYDELEVICNEAGIPLIIDSAEAVGAKYKGRPAGSAGMAAIYSFNGNKQITTSGGGAVLARDESIVSRARWRSQQSRENAVWYEHKEVGYNYRMSNILAAIGNAQLAKLPEILKRKKNIFDFYKGFFVDHADMEDFEGCIPFPCASYTEPSYWMSVFLFKSKENRDRIAAKLTMENIECRPVWKPLHLQPAFEVCEVYGGDVSKDFFERGLCLPSGAGLTDIDKERIEAALSS